MKNTLKFLLLLCFSFITLSSCDQRPEELRAFEDALPPKDLVALNDMVVYFEEIIVNRYNGDRDSLLQRIVDRAPLKEIFYLDENNDLYTQFLESTLNFKDIKHKYQEAFLNNGHKPPKEDKFYMKNQDQYLAIDKNGDTSFIPPFIISGVETIEEHIAYIIEDGYWERIHDSSFFNSLENIENQRVQEYLERRNQIGPLNPSIMAAHILYNINLDKDVFAKRVFLFEMFAAIQHNDVMDRFEKNLSKPTNYSQ